MIYTKTFWFFVLSSLLAGCSSNPKYYHNKIDKNVTINLTTDIVDGAMSKFEVVAGINDLGKDCTADYKGIVELKAGKNGLGLTPGKLTYLAVEVFQKESFHSASRSSMQGTLLNPQKGKQYEVIVKYVDNMFDFRLYEIGKKKKRLPIVPVDTCRSVK